MTADRYALGLDVGSSSIKLVAVTHTGTIVEELDRNFDSLEMQGIQVWDGQGRVDVELLFTICKNMLKEVQNTLPTTPAIISISGFGPSLVFLDRHGTTVCHALTYRYKGAEHYVNQLDATFQKRTGCLHSSSVPFVQLLQVAEEKSCGKYAKITTVNDYLTWRFSDTPLSQLFTTVPNASYTGLYSMHQLDWDKHQLKAVGLSPDNFPDIIPLGRSFPIAKDVIDELPALEHTKIVAGTIDGIDAFWATGVNPGDSIIVGSAGTTGALRKWRTGPATSFSSRLLLCCHVHNNHWADIIPFNNVGSALNWFATLASETLPELNNDNAYLDLQQLDDLAWATITTQEAEPLFSELPIFFPYLEGEPRGPNGRGKKIRGGFIHQSPDHDGVTLYLSLINGIVNMYRHNLEVLDPPADYTEIRLTGVVARRSRLFCHLLATTTQKQVTLMEHDQSVAWATAIRGMQVANHIAVMPHIKISRQYSPGPHDLQEQLQTCYKQYLDVYHNYTSYQINPGINRTAS